MQDLAYDQNRQQRAENRNEVDEETGPVGTDTLDAENEEYLCDERRKHGSVNGDDPTLRIRPDRCIFMHFPHHKRDRGDHRRSGRNGHEGAPVDSRFPTQNHRVDRVGQNREQHDRVADIHFQIDQRQQVAVGGKQRNASDRQKETDDLANQHLCAKEGEIHREDHHGNARLDNGDIDGGRIPKRGVERRVEAGIAHSAKNEKIGQTLFHDRPVAHEIRQGNGSDDRHRQRPA